MCKISGIRTIWEGFDFSYILSILLSLIPSLFCITIHELSHGLAAYALGDDTAKNAGRLTLNPIKHLDVMGLLMLLVFHVGWAKPVPVNYYRFKDPKRGMALTAAAGPAANVLISLVFMLLYGALFIPLGQSRVGSYFLQMIEYTSYISLGLAVFNLLPVPPLDGSKVLFSVIKESAYEKLMMYERYGSIVLFALFATGILGRPISDLVSFLYRQMLPLAQWACDIVLTFYK